MTESQYKRLCRRIEWFGILLDYCDGEQAFSITDFREAVKAAKRFFSAMVAVKLCYKHAHEVYDEVYDSEEC